jgi:tetratricopeptide (TPR) repeat protein
MDSRTTILIPSSGLCEHGNPAAGDSVDISIALNAANELRESCRLPEAHAAYQAILEKVPNNPWARNGLGQVLRRLGDLSSALEHFKIAAAAAPEQLSLRLDIANVLRDTARLPEAQVIYESVLEEAPNNGWALNGLGQVLRLLGKYTTALTRFESAAAAVPKQLSFKLDVANLLRDLSRFGEAKATYHAVLEEAPNNAWAHNGLGQVLCALGDRTGALMQFVAAAVADPSHIGFKLDAANLLRDIGRLDEALAAYRDVLAEAPNHGWALNGLGQVLRTLGDQDGALIQFEAAAAADPSRLSFKLDIASLLRDAGRLTEAGATVDAVLTTMPDNLDGLLHRGTLERWRCNRRAALASFSEASRLHPESAQPLIEMAIEERAIGNPAASIQSLERALELDPGNLGAMMELAEHRWLEENIDEALTVCRRAILLHGSNSWPYLNASRALSDLGQTEEALRLLEIAEEIAGPTPDLLARRISVLRQAGQWHTARSTAHEAATRYPRQFAIWQQCVEIDLTLANYSQAAEALADPPIGSVRDAARVAVLNGKLREDTWRLPEAVEHYKKAIALNPDCAEAHAALAHLSLLLLDISAARRYLQSATDLTASALILRGQLLRTSQSHLGQLLNEFALDKEALRRLINIHSFPLSDRVRPLCRAVIENPDYTPTAICLFIALRQAGLLSRTQCDTTENAATPKIPQRIVQYWDAKVPPADVSTIMSSWRVQNPEFEYARFDDESAQEFLRKASSASVLKAYGDLENASQKADIFRLAYLFAMGGIYADADDLAISSVKLILPAEAGFVACQEDHGTIGNNVLGCAPGNPIIERALSLAATAVNRRDKDMIWLMTGPGLLTRAAAQVLSEGGEELFTRLKEFSILEPGELRRAVAPHCCAQYKRTKVHWLRRQFSHAE